MPMTHKCCHKCNRKLAIAQVVDHHHTFVTVIPYIHYCYYKSGGESQQTQLFAEISCEPYQPVKKHTKPNK